MDKELEASGERRKAKRKKVEVDTNEMLSKCKALQKRMRDILERDNENNRRGRIAIEKIKHVDEICNMLMNKTLQECLVDEGILNEVKGWLEPLPDRSLPNIKVKRRLLDVLKNMRIGREHLVSSGVGKIVYFYSINHKECKEVRNMSKELVRKWINEAFKDEEYSC